jgi:hypothetical protein
MTGPLRLYLETSVVSALFDERTPERRRMTEEAWASLREHEMCISDIVLQEIQLARDELRDKMNDAVQDAEILEVTSAASELADRYLAEGIFPEKYRDDALHVAIATAHGIPFLISWNFKHLVKVRTRVRVNEVNLQVGLGAVEIIAPPEL